jgi:hypothetical protein
VLVVVAPISWMMTSWLISGLPRQFCVMKASSRCSMRFVANTLAEIEEVFRGIAHDGEPVGRAGAGGVQDCEGFALDLDLVGRRAIGIDGDRRRGGGLVAEAVGDDDRHRGAAGGKRAKGLKRNK